MMNLPLKSQIGFQSRNASAASVTFPAPVGGLNTRDAEAAMRPIFATRMENFWPLENFVSLRKGCQAYATGLPSKAKHLRSYSGAVKQLFAFTDSGVFDVTTKGAVGASVFALTEGQVISANFATSGGQYLVGVNGKDSYFYYKSPTWTSVASFAITAASPAENINTSKFTYVTAHQRALFFAAADEMNFYYLPIDQITGTSISRFPIGALFSKGGSLQAIGSWTLDSAAGPDDLAVFLTSEGQAAVYSGTDPNDAQKWGIRGVFNVGRPIGKNPLQKFGGDLLVITEFGITSMTKLLREGQSSSKTSLTDIVAARYQENVFNAEQAPEWVIHIHPKLNMLLLNCPGTSLTSRKTKQMAMNTVTGAWTEFVGWEATAWETFGSTLFAAIGTGVAEMWTASGDFNSRIQCYCQGAWNYLNPRSKAKQVALLRFMVRISGRLQLSFGLDTDFKQTEAWQIIPLTETDLALWDTGKWDEATWAALPEMKLDWLTIASEEGYCVAPRLRVFSGDATFQWSAMDYIFNAGGLMG